MFTHMLHPGNPASGVSAPREGSRRAHLARAGLVVIATLATITVNGLANALPLNGQTTGEISDRFPVYFVPAGYVFAIWGAIYLGLLAYTVYQALPEPRANPRLRRIDSWYVLSALANIAWIFLWHYEYLTLTVPTMLLLLIALIIIYQRLGTGRTAAASRVEHWLVRVPFSLYLGWISVATVANVSVLLYDLNWSGWGIAPQLWAVIMLVVAAGLGVAFRLLRGDIAYAAVIVWALAGIAVKQSDAPLVAMTAGGLAALVGLSLVIGMPRHRRRLRNIA
jgi:benzodiazapine receptor